MKKILLPVRPFQETLHADMCGPASLKIVLGYYGIDASERKLAKLCNAKKGLGVDTSGLKHAARAFGFQCVISNENSFSDIARWLRKGIPVIVDWFTRGRADYNESEVADGHYSVVVGLDDDFIYLQDPEIGKLRKLRRDDFMRVWFDFTGRYPKRSEFIFRQIVAVFR